ncbi:MAG TPA: RDD family protein [Candidatus Bathyarchaeia archaeon]|nr:RDD family protein [Candidatus Bathyarchaeia archaeon]
MATGSSSELDMNHWLYRFLAALIDGIIIGIPGYIIYIVIVGILWPVPAWAGWYWGGWAPWWAMWLLFPLLWGLIWVIYSAFLDTSWGASVGKRVLGLQVQMVDGSKVLFGKAFIRNISKILWFVLLIDWIMGIATPGPDRRQKYTDRMAGTTVVQVRQAFASAAPPPPPPPPS